MVRDSEAARLARSIAHAVILSRPMILAHAPHTGGVPCVWNDSIVFSPQGWPFAFFLGPDDRLPVGRAGVGKVVALVRHRHPHRSFGAVVEYDLFGSAEAQIIFEEEAVGLDIDREAIEVIEPADVDAARGKPLRLVLQRGLQFRRWLIPLGLVIELDDMAIGVATAERRPLPHVAVNPADVEAGALQRRNAALQRLRAARAARRGRDLIFKRSLAGWQSGR